MKKFLDIFLLVFIVAILAFLPSIFIPECFIVCCFTFPIGMAFLLLIKIIFWDNETSKDMQTEIDNIFSKNNKRKVWPKDPDENGYKFSEGIYFATLLGSNIKIEFKIRYKDEYKFVENINFKKFLEKYEVISDAITTSFAKKY